ncbi:Phosphate transport system regulatory protein PhoU [Candidatus Phaeomarinobacter ectocarpi]|uniref:Phosphate-specific transport system accessory protein PhoU n=1 Tax=Candidatus Phaeomarinibacter ectocarpi TaxID=1458461 RepID=X5M9D0_9HYPH|nr:phosphate signaling complex protein PhoU [Candidatus Phaeomarinobacter ectocarpi]CDO60113.1 Phosphate transport system regulatory protein PhoU [Candidatus Phaeomarinobacter ectocarpi]
MQEHIVTSFEEALDSINESLARMGGLAEKQLADSIEAITRRDRALAEQTVASDKQIDALEVDIEAQALRLIALRQPMAIDLRETVSAIKISSDLERIGDLAKNISKRALAVDQASPGRAMQGLERMGRQVLNQLKEVLDAYAQRDNDRAMVVWRRDEEIDEMYNSLFRELLTYMMEDPRTISLCTHLLFVAKNLERIGDHSTNIAETIQFLVTGEALGESRPKGDTTSVTSMEYPTDAETPTQS